MLLECRGFFCTRYMFQPFIIKAGVGIGAVSVHGTDQTRHCTLLASPSGCVQLHVPSASCHNRPFLLRPLRSLAVYYYISNYLFLLALSCICCLVRRPLALAGAALAFFALLGLNDPFASALK